jgi:CheY-like chemotaxis protein
MSRAYPQNAAKPFAFWPGLFQAERMLKPLALVLYEKILPGSQLVNRLRDLNYRVQALNDPAQLLPQAEEHKPMLVLADLESTRGNVCEAIARLRKTPATEHLPVIAFNDQIEPKLEAAAHAVGVTLLVGDAAILSHLPQFLERALVIE